MLLKAQSMFARLGEPPRRKTVAVVSRPAVSEVSDCSEAGLLKTPFRTGIYPDARDLSADKSHFYRTRSVGAR